MTVFPFRLASWLLFQEILIKYFFDEINDDYVISHITSFLSNYAEHPPLSRSLVVDLFLQNYFNFYFTTFLHP